MNTGLVIALLIMSTALMSLNICVFVFNGNSHALEYYSYNNPYMTVLELIYLNDNLEYEKEVYAKVAIEYICNEKCKDRDCIIDGTPYNYDKHKCEKAELYKTIVADYGYYNISIVSIVSLAINCLLEVWLLCELLYKCFGNKCKNNEINKRNTLESSVA